MHALFSRGHCLLVGVPGLAKTLLVLTWSRIAGIQYSIDIQFTPDLMPSDITGTEILEEDGASGQAGVTLHNAGRSSPHHPGG